MYHHSPSVFEAGNILMGWLFILSLLGSLGFGEAILTILGKLISDAKRPVEPVKATPSNRMSTHTSVKTEAPSWASNSKTGELTSTAIEELAQALDQAEAELARLKPIAQEAVSHKMAKQMVESELTALQAKVEQQDRHAQELIDLRFQCRSLQDRLATTEDIPEGKLLIRGRLVVADKHLAIIPSNGKPFRVLKCHSWEYPGETGDQVLLEAIMNADGWTAWRVIVEVGASSLEPLEKGLVERLTARKKDKKTPNFNELDLEVSQNQTRTASHSKTAISLHIVLPTHCRFSLTEDQALDLKNIVVELVKELDLGNVEAIEVGNTEGGRARDHLHLLVSAWNHIGDPIGKQVGRLKALSSGRLRRRHPNLPEKLWSASYWASSAGGSLDKVIAYVEGNANISD